VKERPPPMFATVQEIASDLAVSQRTVARLCITGEMPAHKIGRQWRIRRDDYVRWLRKNRAAQWRQFTNVEMSGGSASIGESRKSEDQILKTLCEERGLTFPARSMIHCDCGRDNLVDKKWEEIGGHKESCRFVQPNFLFKPTGFHINWYKYPFRDSYMSHDIPPKKWREIIRVCIASYTPPHT